MKAIKRLKQRYYNRRADTFLLSYPKCGRTWLRLMLGDIMERRFGVARKSPLQLHKLADRRRGIPCVVALHDWRTGPDTAGDARMESDKSRFAGRRVLLLVRNPCDVVVSNFYQKVFREEKFSGTLGEFIHHPLWGIESIVRYYNIWARDRHLTADFLLLRYEDLRTAPVERMRDVVDFVGISDVSDEWIVGAVDRFSFENMRRREQGGAYQSRGLKPRDAGNPASFKARSGRMGGYRDEMDDEDRVFVETVVREQLSDLFADYREAAGQ